MTYHNRPGPGYFCQTDKAYYLDDIWTEYQRKGLAIWAAKGYINRYRDKPTWSNKRTIAFAREVHGVPLPGACHVEEQLSLFYRPAGRPSNPEPQINPTLEARTLRPQLQAAGEGSSGTSSRKCCRSGVRRVFQESHSR